LGDVRVQGRNSSGTKDSVRPRAIPHPFADCAKEWGTQIWAVG
jgi:hypothetical protein